MLSLIHVVSKNLELCAEVPLIAKNFDLNCYLSGVNLKSLYPAVTMKVATSCSSLSFEA